MSRSKNKRNNKGKMLLNILITVLSLIAVAFVLKIAPNYVRDDIKGKTNLVINNSNVTKRLKADVVIEDGIVYLSKEDIANYFDEFIYYDEDYKQLVTSSDTKLACLKLGEKQIEVNSTKVNIYGTAMEKNGKYYLPFSEMSNIYNTETKYVEEVDTVVIESLDRKLVIGNSTKNNAIKSKPTTLSRTIDKVKKGESIVIVQMQEESTVPKGWSKVRTSSGKVGYVKTNTIANETIIREDLEYTPQIQGKVSLVWDYFSEYARAPKREGKIEGVNVVSPAFFALKKNGKGSISANVGDSGKEYIEWAHNNGYKVWPMLSNESMKETTSEIMRDYQLREDLINNIMQAMIMYDIDGINIDFENMYAEDKELFSRFLIELAPRLQDIGKELSVDVTAPDGSETWSLCFDRNTIGKVADYIMFMAYDQNGASSPKEGTVAGCDWVEANVKKFLGQEEVEANKIVLGIPFYTRLWKEVDGEVSSSVISMKNISSVLPEDVSLEWKDDLKQHYAEYEKDGITYKMWLEDEDSIKAKLDLVEKYHLAGACYWAKDRENQEIWQVISEKLKIEE